MDLLKSLQLFFLDPLLRPSADTFLRWATAEIPLPSDDTVAKAVPRWMLFQPLRNSERWFNRKAAGSAWEGVPCPMFIPSRPDGFGNELEDKVMDGGDDELFWNQRKTYLDKLKISSGGHRAIQ